MKGKEELVSNAIKPRLFISRCLGFDRCRYNGATILDPVVERLKPFVEPLTECPEVAIGLGIPRHPIRLVEQNGRICLFQPETGRDVTKPMADFCERYLSTLQDVDGFLLKYRSPSCGPSQVRIYDGFSPQAGHHKGSGLFAAAVVAHFPGTPLEDEGRLKSFDVRHHYLTRVFTRARFRQAVAEGTMAALIRFHTTHKHLLLAYSETQLRALGRVVANEERHPLPDIFAEYESGLSRAFAKAPRRNSAINVLQHALGYVSDALTPPERRHFLGTLDQYRSRQLPLSVPATLIRSWSLRFGVPYLLEQTFYEPYPAALVDVLDSGKGRPL
jgi:uncharacterized protein YbgA (DUF1722 family)/uncharacterized protein YbbK (DUF523 family)